MNEDILKHSDQDRFFLLLYLMKESLQYKLNITPNNTKIND